MGDAPKNPKGTKRSGLKIDVLEDFILITYKDIYKLKYIVTYIDKHLGTCFFSFIFFSAKSSARHHSSPTDDSLPTVFHIYLHLPYKIHHPWIGKNMQKPHGSEGTVWCRPSRWLSGFLELCRGSHRACEKKTRPTWLCCGHLVFLEEWWWGYRKP